MFPNSPYQDSGKLSSTLGSSHLAYQSITSKNGETEPEYDLEDILSHEQFLNSTILTFEAPHVCWPPQRLMNPIPNRSCIYGKAVD